MEQQEKADIIAAVSEVKDAVNDLNSRIDDLEADLSKIKAETAGRQPSKKFKVAKTKKHPKTGNLVTVPHNETAEAVSDAVKEEGGVSTNEMMRILNDVDVDVSRPTVINIMRRYAAEFEHFTIKEPKKGIRKSLNLKHTP